MASRTVAQVASCHVFLLGFLCFESCEEEFYPPVHAWPASLEQTWLCLHGDWIPAVPRSHVGHREAEPSALAAVEFIGCSSGGPGKQIVCGVWGLEDLNVMFCSHVSNFP